MSRKLRPEERAKSVPKPSDIQVRWIAYRFQSGHSPKAIRDSLNFAQAKSPEFLRNMRGSVRVPAKGYDPFHISSKNTRGWEELSGQRQLTLIEVRRVTDRVRKEKRYAEANEYRKTNLHDFKLRDERRKIQTRYTGEAPWKDGESRARSDLGMVRRWALTEEEFEELQTLADQLDTDLPQYMDVE